MKLTAATIYEKIRYSDAIGGNYPSRNDSQQILAYISRSNYLQVYYDYGIVYLLIVLQILEEFEMYEECAKLKKTIEDYNKISGVDHITRL